MPPERYARTFVIGAFALLAGVFSALKGGRSVVDAWKDTTSIVEFISKMMGGAPDWAIALIALGAANIFAVVIWPWIQSKTTTPKSHPIAYVDLARRAADELGWDFRDEWQLYDFGHAIEAGCNFGLVKMTGKPRHASQSYASSYLDEPIAQADWRGKHLQIYVQKAVDVPLTRTTNWDVFISTTGGPTGWRDPSLLNEEEAMA